MISKSTLSALLIVITLALFSGTVFATPSQQGISRPGVSISDVGSAGLAEGGTTTYTVVLSSQPREDVTVSIDAVDTGGGDDTANVHLHAGSGTPGNTLDLTFTTSNWATSRTVTVTAVDDTVAEGNIPYNITHTVDGSGHVGFTARTLEITVHSNDPLTVTIGTSTADFDATMPEGGGITVSVVLSTAPETGMDVSVAITSNTTNVTWSPSGPLTFSSTTYNTAQMVTFNYQNDDFAESQDPEITFTPTGGGTTTYVAAGLDLNAIDDEMRGLEIVSTQVIAGQAESYEGLLIKGAFRVRLTSKPTGTVTVTIANPNSARIGLSASTLTFTATNWNTVQTVEVTAIDDDIDYDSYSGNLNHTARGGGYDSVTGRIRVRITDDDEASLSFRPIALSLMTVTEGSTAGSFTIKLVTQPLANVTVTSSTDSSDFSISSGATLTFTSVNWRTAQTVTTMATDDDDGANHSGTTTVSISSTDGKYNNLRNIVIDVNVIDDDESEVTADPTAVTVGENAGTNTFGVQLVTQPSGNVTVGITSGDTGIATVNPSNLAFTSTNWNTEQTVTVTGVNNDIDHGMDQTVTITLNPSGSDYDASTVPNTMVTVTQTDDDVAFYTFSPSPPYNVTEGNSTDFTVKPGTEPNTDFDLTLLPSEEDKSTAAVFRSNSSDTFGFTDANWDTAQSIRITVDDDDIVTGDESFTFTIEGDEGEYGLLGAIQLSYNRIEDDTRDVILSGTSATVMEGLTTTYTVVLESRPHADGLGLEAGDQVVIDVTTGDDDEATVNPTSLTFNGINWGTAQTVTVTAVDDSAVDAGGTVVISHSVSTTSSTSDYDSFMIDDFTLTTTNNDTAGITVADVTAGSVTVDEGGTTTAGFVLDTQPTDPVTLAFTESSSAFDVSGSLTFNDSTWNTSQNLTVTGLQDSDSTNETGGTITVTVTSSDSSYNGFSVSSIGVTVTDDDQEMVTVNPDVLTVAENGGTGTFDVQLDTQPSGNVTISVRASPTTGATVDQSSLTFTNSNWNTSQSVTVTGVNDNIDHPTDQTVTITLDPSGSDYSIAPDETVTVTKTDDDTADITVTGAPVAVTEGSTADISVVLVTEPTSDVTINFATTDTEFTLSNASPVFTATNWNTAKRVTVRPVDDDDGTDVTGVTVTADVSSSDTAYDNFALSDIDVTITDDDEQAMTVSPASVSVAENGGTDTFTVRLDTKPTGNVTVNVSSDDTDIAAVDTNTGSMGDQDSLTFTVDTWNTTQSVTVRGVNDDIDNAANRTATITIDPSGADYGSATDESVTVAVTDDDTRGITVTGSPVTVEEGGTNTFSVALVTEPTNNVLVTLTTTSSDFSITGGQLTFTSGDWNTAQDVTVNGTGDDDTVDETGTITGSVSSTDGKYNGAPVSTVDITVTDDDTPELTVTPATITVHENSGSGTFTVRLATQPSRGDVTVTITSDDEDAVTINDTDLNRNGVQDTLTFTSANWSTEQTVTITGVNNIIDHESDPTVDITIDPTSGTDYATAADETVTVTLTDDDTAGITLLGLLFFLPLTNTTLGIFEEVPNFDLFGVVLDTEPTADVAITFSTTSTDFSVTTNQTVTFTSLNWNTAILVAVDPVDDLDAANGTGTITASISSSDAPYSRATVPTLTVNIVDDESQGLRITPVTRTVNEDGGEGSVSVNLMSQPTGTVTVAITSDDTSVATVSPGSMMFDASDWNTAKSFTVTGVNDDIDNGQFRETTIKVNPGGADYNAADLDREMTARVRDDETRGISLTGTPVRVTEGATATFSAVLDTEPTQSVTVTFTESSPDFAISGATTMTFDSTNWNTALSVTVTPTDDADAANETGTISIAVTSSGDYNGFTVSPVGVTVTDNETQGLTVSPTSLTVPEDGTSTASFTIRLNTQPTGAVTVRVETSSSSIATSGPAPTVQTGAFSNFSFSTTNWATNQTVYVKGVNDDVDNAMNKRETTITVNPNGADYNNVATESVSIEVTDEDERGVTLSTETAMVSLNEGTTEDLYTIVLDSQPTSNVTIGVANTDHERVVVQSRSLRFTRSNWNTPKNVSVSHGQDFVEREGETATLTHTISGGDYGSETIPDVTVNIVDDDMRGVKITKDTLPITSHSIMEGDNGSYNVVLESQPFCDISPCRVTINVSSGNSSAVSIAPQSLSLLFTNLNWSVPKSVRFTAVENDIDHPTTETSAITSMISHSAVGGDYEGITIGSVTVTSTDNDTAAVILSRTMVTVAENNSGTYQARLATRPSSGVVTLAMMEQHDEATVTSSLMFDVSDWNTDRTVTVQSPHDFVDENTEGATITHSIPDGPAEYTSLSNVPDVTVELTDDDTRGITVTTTGLTSIDEGAQGTYTIVLRSQPTQAVSIALTVSDSDTDSKDDGTASPDPVEFQPNEWNMAKTVTIMVNDDDIDDDNETLTVRHAVTGGDYQTAGVTARAVTVDIEDNDMRGVRVNPATTLQTPLQVVEGESRTYTVVLLSEPTDAVTIAIAKTGETSFSANESSLTFNDMSWNSTQTVTVSAAEDNDAISNEAATFAHMVTGGDYGANSVTADSVFASTTDDDANNVSISKSLVMFEEGGNDTYLVRLTTDPEDTVTLRVMVTEGRGDNVVNITPSPQTIMLTGTINMVAGNWNTGVTVTISSPEDLDAVGETAVITHTVTSGNYTTEAPIGTVSVTVTDPDEQGVAISDSSFTIEEGDTDTYTVVLETQPVGIAVVTVNNVNNVNTADLTTTPEVRFNSSNWNTPMTVNLAAVDDDIDDDSESVTLGHTASGADYGDAGVTISRVTVNIVDNDTRGVIVSVPPQALGYTEETSAAYTIVLNSEPLGAVTIDPESSNPSKVTVAPARLTFNAGNWNTPQTITLGAPHDPDVDDEMAEISHTVSGADYAGETADGFRVSIEDNDMERVNIAPTQLRFVEGGTGVYEVWLDTQPSVGQTVKISVTDDSAQVRVTPDELTFERDTWDIPQQLTVQSLTDANDENEIVTISLTVTNYGPVAVADPVMVTVAEFDIAALSDLGALQELTATERNGAIILSWKAPPPNADGRRATLYEYRYRPTVIESYSSSYASGEGWVKIPRGPTARFVSISGLIHQAEYTLQVRAVDAALLAEADSDDNFSTMVEVTSTYLHRTKSC